MKNKAYLILFITLLTIFLCINPVSALESITISNPADGKELTGETEPIYIQISNSSMSAPFIQYTPHDVGTWLPTNQIDNNLFVKYWDSSQVDNGTQTISVKTTLGGVDYFDSITVTISNSPTESESETELIDMLVDGLADGGTYQTDTAVWIQVLDNTTKSSIDTPTLSIYNPSLKKTIQGTSSGLIKIDWTDLDQTTLEPDTYLITIKKEGYTNLDLLATLQDPDQKTTEDITDKLSIFGLDTKIIVNAGSDVWVTDDQTGDPIEDISIKIIDKRTSTVLRTEKTDEYGYAYIIWDIAGEYNIGFNHPDYKVSSTTVTVTNPPYIQKIIDKQEFEPAPDPTPTPEPPEEHVTTRDEVEMFLKNELIDGKPYLDVLKEEGYAAGVINGTQQAKAEYDQKAIDKPLMEVVQANMSLGIIGLLSVFVILFIRKYTNGSNPLFKESVDRSVNRFTSKIFKSEPNDNFDPDNDYNHIGPQIKKGLPDLTPATETNPVNNLGPVPEIESAPPLDTTQPIESPEVIPDTPITQDGPTRLDTPEAEQLLEELSEINPGDADKIDDIFLQLSNLVMPSRANMSKESNTDAANLIYVKLTDFHSSISGIQQKTITEMIKYFVLSMENENITITAPVRS